MVTKEQMLKRSKKRIFIKNILDVEVDGLKQTSRYTVTAMYDVEQEGGWYKLEQIVIEDWVVPWSEIEAYEGGIAGFNKEFKETWKIEE